MDSQTTFEQPLNNIEQNFSPLGRSFLGCLPKWGSLRLKGRDYTSIPEIPIPKLRDRKDEASFYWGGGQKGGATALFARNNLRKSTLYALRSTLYALRSTLYALRSTLYALRSTLYALRSTLYALRSTLYAQQLTADSR